MHVVQMTGLAVMRHRFFGPQPLDQIQVLHKTLGPLALGDTARIEFDVPIAEPDAKYEVASRQYIQCGNRLSGLDRIVQVEQKNTHPNGHLTRLRNQPRQ